MKFGQALSVFEAALPEEIGRPVPRGADQAAGGRPADARGDRAQGAGRAARAGLAGAVPSTSTTPRPPRPASARCTSAACWARRRPRTGRASRSSIPGAGDALLTDLNQLVPARAAVRALSARAGRQAAAGRAARADHRGARLRAGGRVAARASPRRTPTTRRSSIPAVLVASAPGDGHRVDRRALPLSEIIAQRHPGAARPGRAAAGRALHSRRRRAGLLHADPHPGNFRLLPGRPARRARLRRGGAAARGHAPSRSAG